jgi:hyaluronan synthase
MNKLSASCCDIMTVRPKTRLNWDMLEPVVKVVILMASVLILIIAIDRNILFQKNPLQLGRIENLVFSGLFLTSMLIFISSLVFRTFLWFRYRPFDSGQVKSWPTVTVVVPAYNEGKAVYQTICSIAGSNYPAGQLKIITVNDGSKDDTLGRFPGLVEIIDFPRNRGKRQAIYEAYRRAGTSTYLVTIDSDTTLEPSALKEILTPLILSEKIAAVTGRIKVWNKESNILTRMLNAHFAMAFDFTRAIQSTFSCVFCLAGAFSAYRVSVLRGVMAPFSSVPRSPIPSSRKDWPKY